MHKRIFPFVLIVLTIFCVTLSACNNQANEYDKLQSEIVTSSSPVSTETDRRTLRFACNGYDSITNYWINHANAYMQSHSDVDIQIEILAETSEGGEDILSTQLMAGSAADVLVIYPSQKLLQSGNFLNLQPYVASDPDFNDENYFMNIIDAVMSDGCLYAIPYNFTINNVYAMRKDLDPDAAEWFESAETVTYKDMVDLYETVGEPNGLYFYKDFSPVDAIDYYLDLVVDLDAKTCNFQNEELLSQLKRIQNIPMSQFVTISEDFISYIGSANPTEYLNMTDPEGQFLFLPCPGISYPDMYFPYTESLYTVPRAITSAGGNIPFCAVEYLAITKDCGDPALAWDFVKFCMSNHETPYEFNGRSVAPGYEYGSTVGYSACVNRMNFYAQCEQFSYNRYDLTKTSYDVIPEGDRDQVVSRVAATLRLLSANATMSSMPFDGLKTTLWPEEYLYITGAMSAEEMLRRMDDRIALYLNE